MPEVPPRFTHAELAGNKIRLRPIRSSDAHTAYELLRDGVVTQTLVWDGPATGEEITLSYRDHSDGWAAGGDYHNFAIEETSAPDLILGSIRASRQEDHPQQVVIGYWLGEPSWGKGYASEAVQLVTHFAFAYLNVVRAFAEVFVGNDASRRVLEKNGYHLDGTLRHHVLKRGEWRDRWFFTMLREEWETSRNNYRPDSEHVTRL